MDIPYLRFCKPTHDRRYEIDASASPSAPTEHVGLDEMRCPDSRVSINKSVEVHGLAQPVPHSTGAWRSTRRLWR